jgi:hypothetical protein
MSTETNWKESLPEQLRDAPFFAKAQNLDAVLSDIKNAAQHMGNSIRIPSDDASDADKVTFRKKAAERIGGLMEVPNADDEEGYVAALKKLGMPDNADDYGDLEGKTSAEIRELAKNAGMTKKQYEKVFGELAKINEGAQAQAQQVFQEGLQTVKDQWGLAFEKRTAEIGDFLLKSEAPPELVKALAEGKLSPANYGWLYDMASKMSSGGAIIASQDGRSPVTALTPQEIQGQIVDIQRNPDYRNSGSANQKYLVQKMVKLQEMLQ